MTTMASTGKRTAEEAELNDAAASNKISPYNRYFADVRAFIKDEVKNGLGPMLIKGVEDDSSEDEDEQIDADDLTTEQMQAFRVVAITQNREKQLHSMRELVLGDQANDTVLMFNTSFSYHVDATWDSVKKSLSRTKDPSQKLDMLFAYSYNLDEFDVWMHDNEGDMGRIVKGLATAWKSLLTKHSDEALGWDCKYTKPGMMQFLTQFKSKIEGTPKYMKLGKFNFQ
ncbi:hypothetical protein FisN_39Hh029 [Fistulifera solaris]|uniref:Uncharacterized protein n=1 Tax=Fistulifera solaris TaxID=1519565 RepID=A0A1Z5KAJ5_FISSO|nr:hypothetical protein FisN_39Hh029 [Fistulifera solaris]|eukprot:GAX23175.1 hypothetical protein FisN_39Hh029 [Fistulifera solaris]